MYKKQTTLYAHFTYLPTWRSIRRYLTFISVTKDFGGCRLPGVALYLEFQMLKSYRISLRRLLWALSEDGAISDGVISGDDCMYASNRRSGDLARKSVTSHYMNAELVASDDSHILNGRLYKFPWKNVFEVNYIQREQKLNWLKRPEQHKNNTIVFKRKNLINTL
jgi:hypothetical protein